MSDGIDPVVDSVELPAPKANVHSTTGDPHGEQLPPRNKTMLPTRKAGQHPINAVPLCTRRAFATHTVVNARFVGPDCGHATTLDDRDAPMAR